jgi:acyl-CoA oxidase
MINDLHILGCYVQTEMGHGSNVAGLETTATFDKEKDEFIIHTPNIRATKFWPGSLGTVATHAVVFARLKIGESDFGP